MATKRYSGNITVALSFVDSENHYKCNVSVGGKRGKTIIVNPPRHLTRSVDSADAFDDAAKAAISFAADEGLDTDGADHTGSGVAIHRKAPSKKTPAPPRGFTKGR